MPTTSTAGSPTPLREPVRRAACVTHGKPATIGDAVAQLERIAAASGVQLGDDDPDIAVVLGGDGTMLRALQRWLGTQVPVIGVNFGRVGFLASMRPEEMEEGLRRVFEDAVPRLAPNGWLIVEFGYGQDDAVSERQRLAMSGNAAGSSTFSAQPPLARHTIS